jgi:hypothetical protein
MTHKVASAGMTRAVASGMTRAVAVLCLASMGTGCVTGPRPEPQVACSIVRGTPLSEITPRDLYQIARGTPVEETATSAYAQLVTTYVFYGLGGAALASGLIMGFAVNSATDPAARNAGFALAGGALGLGALSLIIGYTGRIAAADARLRLRAYADRCQ